MLEMSRYKINAKECKETYFYDRCVRTYHVGMTACSSLHDVE